MQISWQTKHIVNLEVPTSWLAQFLRTSKCRCRGRHNTLQTSNCRLRGNYAFLQTSQCKISWQVPHFGVSAAGASSDCVPVVVPCIPEHGGHFSWQANGKPRALLVPKRLVLTGATGRNGLVSLKRRCHGKRNACGHGGAFRRDSFSRCSEP